MATTQPHLELTDTVTSIKIMDSSANTPALIAAMSYRLSYGTWAPKIAKRNTSPFGLPYLPVLEELTIDIKGATVAEALSKLQDLNRLLDQAERWYNNELVDPVYIYYQPKGSNKSTYMRDVVIGRGADPNNAEVIVAPADFNSVGETYYIKGIQLSFWRKNGLWLCEEEDQTLGGAHVAQPGPMTVTWSDIAAILSPVDITIGAGGAPGAGTSVSTSGITAVTNDNRYLGSFLGTAELGGFSTATADVARFPTGANVARFTANPSISGLYDIDSLALTECEYFAAYVKVRNNSTTIDAYIRGGTALTSAAQQPETRLPANPGATPLIVFLGIFPTRGRTLQDVDPSVPNGNFGIAIRSAGASLTVDVDSILIIGINRATNIIASSGITHPLITASTGIYILGRLLEEPQGEYAIGAPPSDVLQSYTGSIYNFTGSNASVAKTSVAHYFIDSTRWNLINGAASAKLLLDLNATRYKAYLTPE